MVKVSRVRLICWYAPHIGRKLLLEIVFVMRWERDGKEMGNVHCRLVGQSPWWLTKTFDLVISIGVGAGFSSTSFQF